MKNTKEHKWKTENWSNFKESANFRVFTFPFILIYL